MKTSPLHPRVVAGCAALCFAAATAVAEGGAQAQALTEWVLAQDQAGITIHTRISPGDTIREFRVVTRFQAPLEAVTAVFEDVSRFPEWYDRCVEARRLDGDRYAGAIYVRADLPFPFADRDVAFQTPREQTAGGIRYRSEAEDGLTPEVDGLVRVPELLRLWTFERFSDDETRVTFQQRSDPGGALPSWLTNSMATVVPRNSLTALRQLVDQASSAE